MKTTKTILVALDDSDVSERVLSYAAEQAGNSNEVHLLLCHVLPPMPPQLLESRGAEDPDEERRIENLQQKDQSRWTAKQSVVSKRVLENGKRRLQTLGVPPPRIHTTLVEPADAHGEVAETILKTAKEMHCDVIVVGRQAFSALREMLHTHLADVLQANASGLDVRIVD